jgi:hypothetical protein
MTKIEERTIANMDVVLEEVCRCLLHGGDPRSRKYVAKKLMQSAKKGNVTREGLRHVPAAHFLTCRDSDRLSRRPQNNGLKESAPISRTSAKGSTASLTPQCSEGLRVQVPRRRAREATVHLGPLLRILVEWSRCATFRPAPRSGSWSVSMET